MRDLLDEAEFDSLVRQQAQRPRSTAGRGIGTGQGCDLRPRFGRDLRGTTFAGALFQSVLPPGLLGPVADVEDRVAVNAEFARDLWGTEPLIKFE